MKRDLQSAARKFSRLVGAPDAVGVLGWGMDGEPRIRVFADEQWLRSNAALPECFAGYRVEVQVRGSVRPYGAYHGSLASASAGCAGVLANPGTPGDRRGFKPFFGQ